MAKKARSSSRFPSPKRQHRAHVGPRRTSKETVPELVARSISDRLGGTVTFLPRAKTTDSAEMLDQIAMELVGFEGSKFLVTLTMGRDPVYMFMNDAAGRAIGVDPHSLLGVPVRERFTGPAVEWWLEQSDQAYRTGVPILLEDADAPRLREDGTLESRFFDCVLQPVRGIGGGVIGMLFICTTAAAS